MSLGSDDRASLESGEKNSLTEEQKRLGRLSIAHPVRNSFGPKLYTVVEAGHERDLIDVYKAAGQDDSVLELLCRVGKASVDAGAWTGVMVRWSPATYSAFTAAVGTDSMDPNFKGLENAVTGRVLKLEVQGESVYASPGEEFPALTARVAEGYEIRKPGKKK